jgi:hypothetical protein
MGGFLPGVGGASLGGLLGPITGGASTLLPGLLSFLNSPPSGGVGGFGQATPEGGWSIPTAQGNVFLSGDQLQQLNSYVSSQGGKVPTWMYSFPQMIPQFLLSLPPVLPGGSLAEQPQTPAPAAQEPAPPENPAAAPPEEDKGYPTIDISNLPGVQERGLKPGEVAIAIGVTAAGGLIYLTANGGYVAEPPPAAPPETTGPGQQPGQTGVNQSPPSAEQSGTPPFFPPIPNPFPDLTGVNYSPAPVFNQPPSLPGGLLAEPGMSPGGVFPVPQPPTSFPGMTGVDFTPYPGMPAPGAPPIYTPPGMPEDWWKLPPPPVYTPPVPSAVPPSPVAQTPNTPTPPGAMPNLGPLLSALGGGGGAPLPGAHAQLVGAGQVQSLFGGNYPQIPRIPPLAAFLRGGR